jgi:hypothetical protein
VSRARIGAAVVAVALAAVLSLDWFALDVRQGQPTPDDGLGGGGILNLLNTYSDAHLSGWRGLGLLSLALLGLGAAGTVAGLRLPAVVVTFAALVALVVDLPLRDDDLIAVRWPAYAGVALAIALLGCAYWSWRRPAPLPNRQAS